MRACRSSSVLFKLCLLLVLQKACSSMSVRYFLAKPAENCTTSCMTRGMSCVKRDAFSYDSLYIFHSINVTCTTVDETNWYHFNDQPNLVISGGWMGRCTGFWYPDSSTHCGYGGNKAVRRLCPCEHIPTTVPIPPTVKTSIATATTTTVATVTTTATSATTTATATTVTTTATTALKSDKVATESNAATTTAVIMNTRPPANTENSRRTDVGTSLSTWKIIVILIVLFVLCGVAIALIVAYKRKSRKREQPGPARILSPRHQPNQRIGQVSQNPVYIESMIDITQTRIVTRSGSKDYLCDAIDDTYSSPFSSEIHTNVRYEEVNIKPNFKEIDEYQNPHYETLEEAFHKGKERSESLNVLYEKIDNNDRSPTDNILYDRAELEDNMAQSDNPIYGQDNNACVVNTEDASLEQSAMYASVEYNPIYGSGAAGTCAMKSKDINMEDSGIYANVKDNAIYGTNLAGTCAVNINDVIIEHEEEAKSSP